MIFNTKSPNNLPMAFEKQSEPTPSPLGTIIRVIVGLLIVAALIYIIVKFIVPKVSSMFDKKTEIVATFQPSIPAPLQSVAPVVTPTPTPLPTSTAIPNPGPNLNAPSTPAPSATAGTTARTSLSKNKGLPRTGPETPFLGILGVVSTGSLGMYYIQLKRSYKKAARSISVLSQVD
jgi:hypothetical protein